MYEFVILGLVALLASSACASFDANLNYDSPSRRHPNLGINIPAVSRRSLKRDAVALQPSQLKFTHGVASGDPYPDSVIIWTRVAPSLVSSDSNVAVEGPVPLYSHETESYIKADANPICVEWTITKAADSGIQPINSTKPANTTRPASGDQPVSSGTAYTTGDIDYTVKVRYPSQDTKMMTHAETEESQVEATGLQAFTAYNYQFTVCGSNNKSPVGLTKTAPAEDADVDEVSLAVFSCSNYRTSPNSYNDNVNVCTE